MSAFERMLRYCEKLKITFLKEENHAATGKNQKMATGCNAAGREKFW